MNVTLDGFMAGPHAELDWHFRSWSNDMAEGIAKELMNADTIILGRVTYSAMENYWPSRSNSLSLPRDDMAFADMMNRYKKIVVSTTLRHTSWHNAEIVKGNVTEEIYKLKQCPGKNMIIYGSGKLVGSLVRENLVDEFLLWLHPVLLGKGKPFFTQVDHQLNLELIQRMSFSSGVVALRYQTLPSASDITSTYADGGVRTKNPARTTDCDL